MILLMNSLFIAYIILIVGFDVKKLASMDVVIESQIFMVTIKASFLCFHVLMIVLSLYSLDYFMKLMRFQAMWNMFLFAVCTHLQIVHDFYDLIVCLFGLYYCVPQVLIYCNESLLTTMICFLLIHGYPTYLVVSFQD